MKQRYIKIFLVLLISNLILMGCSNHASKDSGYIVQTTQEDSIEETEYIVLKIIGDSPWRGVYGNNSGLSIASGVKEFTTKIKNDKSVVATIQNLGNNDLEVKLIKAQKDIDSSTIKQKYVNTTLCYEMGDFNPNIEGDKLNPSGDEDGDGEEYGLKNYCDPLPKQFGTVTEAEYKDSLRLWSEKMINIIDKSIDTVERFNEGQIDKITYFDELGSFSQFSSSSNNKEYWFALDGLNNIIPPKKYMENEYYWKAVTDMGIIFDNFSNGDSSLNNGYIIKQYYFNNVIDNLHNAYELSGVDLVDELRWKLHEYKDIIPDKP